MKFLKKLKFLVSLFLIFGFVLNIHATSITFDYESSVTGLDSNTADQTVSGETLRAVATTFNLKSGSAFGTVLEGTQSLATDFGTGEETKVTFSLTSGGSFDLTSFIINEYTATAETIVVTSSKGSANFSLSANTKTTMDVSAHANAANFQGITSFEVTASDGKYAGVFDNIIISVSSSPTVVDVNSTASGSKKVGDVVPITVNFSENVNVTGTPRLELETGSTDRNATYSSGSGSSALVFNYTVQTGDESSDLAYTGTSALVLNSGTIKNSAGDTDANLTLATVGAANSLSANEAIVIDTTAPAFSSVSPSPSSTVANANVGYTLSEAITSGTVTFTRTGGTADGSSPHVVSLTGTELNVGVRANAALTNAPTLVSGAIYTISFDANDSAGNSATTVNTTSITFDNTAPAFSSVSPSPSSRVANANIGYTLSEAITAGTVTFTRTGGTADGSSPHVVSLTGTELNAGVRASAALTNAPTLVDGTVYTVSFDANDSAGNSATTVNSTSVTYDTSGPTVSSVSVPSNGTYIVDQNLTFTINTNENVTVDTTSGTPSLGLTIGSTGKVAVYESGSGTQALVFIYTVQSGLSDTDGIVVGALSLNSATMKDSAGNDMNITLNSVGVTTSVLVDSISPTVSSVSVPSDAIYKTDENLSFTVNTSEVITVTGTPRLSLDINGTTKYATYASGTGTTALVFGYTVESGLIDSNGIDLNTTIDLNSGSLKDSAGNDLNVTLNSVSTTTAVLVDSIAPTVSSFSPNDGNTSVGRTDNLVVTFDENISKGSGNIEIKKASDNSSFESIAVTDGKITVSGASLTINPAGTLDLNTSYYVQIASTAITDIAGNTYAGIADTTTWNFTTVANQAPTISGTSSNQAVDDNVSSPITPFSGVTLADAEGDNISVSLSLDTSAKGTLSSSSISSASVSSVQASLRAITFTPAQNRVAPDATETTIITISVNDGTSETNNTATTIISTSKNDTPVITSNGSGASAVINVVENNTSVTTVVASDADSGDTKTYSISGGADSSKFDINSSTGVLTFKTAPNYESPTDSGSDNTYEVIVQVADSNNSTDSQTLNVTVTNDTTEAPTVSLSVNNSTVAENSGTSTITATLSEAVSAVTTVTIGLKSGSTTDLNSDFNLSSTTITINANSTTGTAIFTSLDDLIDDNSEIATIEINSVSGGESASENGTQEVNITITDDDTAGVTLNKTTASVDENGTTSTFTIILDTKPTGNVIIDLNSSDTSEATLSVSSLTFTTSDWNTTKTVTITGVDDNIVDGDINSTITASINTGSTVDSVYDAISNKTLTVTTRDDDSAGFSLSKTTASVSENNTTDTFTVVLDKAPTSNVELNITISDQSEATVSPSSLTFSDSNWNIAQTVTITGVDDNLTDGSVESNITVSVIDANSNDSFDPLANQTVTVTTTDNDNNLPVITQGTPQAKTINEDNNLSFDLNATDDDNDTLTWSIETDATNGSASTSGNGNSKTITYSPNSNYNGNDTFKVKVTDSKGGTDTIDINVTITPINDTPSFDFNLSDITLLEDNGTTPYDINISDIDGDDLNLTIESNNTNIITVSKGWTNSIAQGNYNVAQDFNLSTVSNANGLVRITLSLTDGNLSTSQTFDVNVSAVNDIPVINTNFSNVSMDEDNGTTNYDLNISDIDLSDLNLTIESNNTSLITVSTNYINDINSSTYSNLLDFNLSTVADANGIAKITLTLSDGELNATSSFDVNIGAVNDVPVIETNLSNLSKNEDSASSFIDLNTTDVDSNASTVTYSVDSNNSSIASARVVNGVLIVSPKENANGIVSIEVNATVDGQTVTKTFTYTLNSVNDRPKIDHLENIFHDQSSSIISNTISFGISDDTNVTSLSVTTVNTTLIPDANISVRKDSDTSASLTYAIAANETGKSKITVTASDGNLSYSESFTVRVNASNDSLCVDNTKTELSFDTIKNGNVAQNYIINDLNLVSTINTICSSTITWSSSDTNVIENNGSVTVGSTDSTVAVTATIVKGENNATKQFLLTVPAGTVSDSTAVSNITFQDIKNTNNRQDNIVADLTLLSSSLGKDINWSSTNEAVIDPYTFVVSRTGSDENVVLTATIGSSTKDFNLTVIATPTSTSDKLAKDMSWLNFERILDKNRDNNNVIYNLIKPLPSSGPNDSTITWTTSDSAVITTDGDVIRDTTSDKYITMTASFDNSGTTNTKEFLLRVLKNETTTSDANVTFKQVVDNNNTVAVSFSEDGSDTNTTASFDSSLVSSLEKIISDDSIQSVLELTDKIINLFLNTDGTAQSQAEFTNDDNESVISSVKIDATKSSTSVDSNGTVLSTVSIDANTTVKGQLNSDGSVSHSVDINSSDSNKTTSASATIPGSKVEADSAGNVETTSEIKSGNTIYKAVATSDKNGNTKTKFITINLTTGEETDVDNTLDDTTPYAPGNTVEISEINGTVYIKTTAPLDGNLNVK